MKLHDLLRITLIILGIGVLLILLLMDPRFVIPNKQFITYNIADLPKKIVFWNTIWGQSFEKRFRNEDFQNCPVGNCILTSNRSQIEQADAVIFHATKAYLKYEALPKVRKPFQKYVYFLLESEVAPSGFAPNWPGFFNLTMTYRLDSDVVYKYGHYRERKEEEQQRNETINYAKEKTKLAVWFVSHCETKSRREDLVKHLQTFIDIDIYGDCGNMSCPRIKNNNQNSNCMEMAEKKYKFYLSFENAVCPDYVTEKLFTALQYNIVPVTYGGAIYSKFAPPESYINVFDFKDVKELADYLILLDGNDEMYNRYFEWKKKYFVVSSLKDGFCNLCEKLNRKDDRLKIYEDLPKWWNTGRCITNRTWVS